jgi:REP element-mobilizing transposase RayT
MQRPRQLDLSMRTWGGRRPGSGRPPGPGRRAVPHRRRATHDPRCPVHVTLRAEVGVPSLRAEKPFAAIRRAFAAASRNGFRLLHFSVQSDHLHLVVEADAPTRLARGVQGLAIREVRNALVYVLQNWRKHVPGADGFDPRSSASAFAGWMTALPRTLTVEPVVAARTWLASVGWRRHGLLGLRELPRGAPGRR